MRIISGQFKSRRLKAIPPDGTRPTSDKLRETLFNILGDSVRGCCFLDGCAGVGAIGIEAISRGADHVVFADPSRKTAGMIRENLKALGISSGFTLLQLNLDRALAACQRNGIVFDIAFVDPPYDCDDVYDDALANLGNGKLIAPAGMAILEHSRKKPLPPVAGNLRNVRTLHQGDSALDFYRPEAM